MEAGITTRLVELGDVIDVFDNQRVPLSGSQRRLRQGNFRYYGAQGVIDSIDDFIFDGQYVLVAEDGENLNSRKLPLALIAQGKFWVNNHAHVIKGRPKVLDDHYLLYCLNQMDIRPFVTGAAQPKLSQGNLRRIEIELPPLEEQRRIAGILSVYDDLIENCQRRIKILEEMARSLYREWFVHFRYPGHESVPLINSPVGPIPKGWDVLLLGEACELVMGQSPKSEHYNSDGIGYPFHQGVTDFGTRYPTDRLFCSVVGRMSKPGDILFSVRAPVGRLNIAKNAIVLGRGLSAIRAKDGLQELLWENLSNLFTQVDMIGNGSIFNSVTKADVYNVKLVYPDPTIGEHANGLLKPMHKEIGALSEMISNLSVTRELLLSKLFK